MKLLKKAIASIALVALISGLFSTGAFAYSNEQFEAANDLASRDIIVTKADATGYSLNQKVLRQEIAAVARGIAKLSKATEYKGTYSDVTMTTPNDWAWQTVEPLADAGIIAKNATFRPEDPISKAEAIGMMMKATFGSEYSYDESKWTTWQEQVVTFAVEKGVASSFTNYNDSATRGFVFEAGSDALSVIETDETKDEGDILSDLLGDLMGDDTDDTVADDTTTDDTVADDTTTDDTTTDVVSGDNVLTASLSPDTPDSVDLPSGAEWVAVAKFDLTAGSEDVTISSITLKRNGLGASDAVLKVAIFTDEGRASKVKTFNSSTDDAAINFSPAIVVKAGETKTLTAKVNTSSAGNFGIELVSINATSTVEWANISANDFEVKSTSSSTWTISYDWSSSNPKLGEVQAEILKFKVKNDSSSNEDITLTEITLKENGTINEESELANISLYYGDEKIAEIASMTSKYATFVLNKEIVMKEWKTEKFVVKADILAWASNTIQFYLDNDLDVSATASKYGYVTIDGTGLESGDVSALTVQAGEITISTIEPEKTDIRKDKNDVEFGTLKLVANSGKDLELQEFKVSFTDSGIVPKNINTLLENIELYDETNGTIYDLSIVGSVWTTEVYGDTDLAIAIANWWELLLTIRADTQNVSTIDGAKLTASVDVSSNVVIKELWDDTAVSDIIPAAVSFKTVSGVASSVTINRINQSATKTSVIGSNWVEVLNFEVKSDNDASDLTFDEVKVEGVVVDNASSSTITVSWTGLVNWEDPAAGDIVITKGDATTDTLSINIATWATSTNNVIATLIATTISADSDYTASATDNVVTISWPIESIAVTSLNSAIATVDTDRTTALTVAHSNNTSNTTASNKRINALYLYQEDVTEPLDKVSGSQLALGVATFNGFKVTIPKNSSKRFMVKVDLIDDSNQSNDTLNFQITGYWVKDDESDDVCVSADTDNDGDLTDQTAEISSTRIVTIRGVGTLAASVDNTDTDTDNDKNILGWVTSEFVASYELTATNEDIKVVDFQLFESGSNTFANGVKEVIVYGNDKTTEIARETVNSETVTFTNANFIVEEGTSNIYVKVITHKQGKDQAGTQTADLGLKLTITDAEWYSSSKAVTAPSQTAISKLFSVNSTNISAVSFVSSYNNVNVSSSLSAGDNNIAILSITTNSSVNTDSSDGGSLKTALEQIKFTVDYANINTFSGSDLSIERIWGAGNSAVSGLDVVVTDGAEVTLTWITDWTSDDLIDNGTTAYYLIKADLSLTGTNDHDSYIKVSFPTLNDSEIKYKSDGSSNNTSVTDLRLWITTLNGTKIND